MSSLIVVRSASDAAPVTTLSFSIFAHDADHLVQFRSNLHAASKSAIRGYTKLTLVQTVLFSVWFPVQQIEPRLGHVDRALGAVDSCTVVIDWRLERLHLVLVVSASALGVNSWHSVSLDHLQQTLTSKCSHSSWGSIRWYNVDPDYLIGHFDSTSFHCWSDSCATEALRCTCKSASDLLRNTYNLKGQ